MLPRNCPDSQCGKLLLHAARGGQAEAAELLLASGADINARDTKGWISARHGYEIVPLHFAAEFGGDKVAKLLLAHGADVNARNQVKRTPLHLAAENQNLAIVELLLVNGADANSQAEYDYTPLHLAARTRNQAIAELMLINGADVNAKEEEINFTPLHECLHKDMFGKLEGCNKIMHLRRGSLG
jgi:ankyrin repeat protein